MRIIYVYNTIFPSASKAKIYVYVYTSIAPHHGARSWLVPLSRDFPELLTPPGVILKILTRGSWTFFFLNVFKATNLKPAHNKWLCAAQCVLAQLDGLRIEPFRLP